jgi:tRNA threonylcarbamoyladenosine biosynthesis protein TsaE
MNNSYITNSFSETQNLGEEFIKKTKNRIIALHGDLGSGKTTFVQGLAKALGIKKRIISPTFIIIRSYKINLKNQKSKIKNPGKESLYHIDLYRISGEGDVAALELAEIIKNPKNIVVIEWPEKIKMLLPKESSKVYFKYIDENRRKIVII